MKTMRILDLFAGIGGFSHAFENAAEAKGVPGAFKTHAFCEIDKAAQSVLRKHWPMTPIFDDVKTIPVQAFKNRIEIICGGFPCQDISVAGQKRGLINEDGEATRSGLWFEYKRLIKEVRPKWVIIENVRNLLSNGLATVLQDLSEIGYDAEWEIIPASAVGAPHFRERIWIVAYPRCAVIANTNSSKIREQQQRSEAGWIGIQAEGETFTSNDGQERKSKHLVADSLCPGLERSDVSSSSSTTREKTFSDVGSSGISGPIMVPNTYDFRFWPTFATEEKKFQWWTAATAKFRSRWETESGICRVDDGLSKELDKGRAQRIKQLGNSIVPPIVEIIAQRILEIEGQ